MRSGLQLSYSLRIVHNSLGAFVGFEVREGGGGILRRRVYPAADWTQCILH